MVSPAVALTAVWCWTCHMYNCLFPSCLATLLLRPQDIVARLLLTLYPSSLGSRSQLALSITSCGCLSRGASCCLWPAAIFSGMLQNCSSVCICCQVSREPVINLTGFPGSHSELQMNAGSQSWPFPVSHSLAFGRKMSRMFRWNWMMGFVDQCLSPSTLTSLS